MKKYTITEEEFLKYMLFHGSDQEYAFTLKSLGEKVVDALMDNGEFKITIQDLMNEACNVWSDFLLDYPKDQEPDFIDISLIILVKE